jgi:hypothetical protein
MCWTVIYLTQFERTGVSKANELLSVKVEYQNERIIPKMWFRDPSFLTGYCVIE